MKPSTVKKLVTKPKAKAKGKFKHKTREQWLMAAVKKLQPMFKKHGYPIPDKLQVSCGWPHGHRKETIGQCFYKSNTADGTVHLFVSPALGDDGVRVLDVLVHELIHASVGEGHGHRGDFKKLARMVGLEGPLTATIVSEGTALHNELKKIHATLGAYPHSVINYKLGRLKKEATWVRVKSTHNSAYTMAVSIKNLKESGFPVDPWGKKMVLKTAVRI